MFLSISIPIHMSFTAKNLKFLAFSNLKSYFIYFNNQLHNISNIKGFILTFNVLKYYK